MPKKQTPKQQKKTEEPRERHFEWYGGMSDAVLREIRKWYIKYQRVLNGDQGIPPNEITQKTINNKDQDEDRRSIKILRFKQNIGFNYNQIQWLSKTITEEDPRTGPARAFNKAYEKFKLHRQNNPADTGMRGEEYDFSFEEVRYIYEVLSAIKLGRLTPGQKKDEAALKSKQIEKADW